MNFLIYNLSEESKIDHSQCADSPLLIKPSLDSTKSFICYIDTPEFVNNLTTKEGPFNYSEMMFVLENAEWKM